MYETKIHDIDDLRKLLMETCFEFDRNIVDAGAIIWDHASMLVVDTLNTCCDLSVYLYDSPAHFVNC